MYEEAVSVLANANLQRYEVSNFAREGCESRHNTNYWNGVQYIGVGPGAHGRFYTKDSKWRESRIQTLDPLLWQQIVAKNGHATQVRRRQSQLDILQELIATSLRTVKGVRQSRYTIDLI
jgi:coproporphyrinogen III oxidase-like Fe-S oxidoreductase